MSIADLGTLKQRRQFVENVRDVVPVALDLFQLGRENEIAVACDTALCNLLRLALVDYRDRYRDTRREHLIRRDVDKHRTDGYNRPTRSLVCLFCAELLAIRATTQQSYRIAQLMIEDAKDKDRVLDRGFDVKLCPSGEPAVWCVADVREAIRPHVVVCALTSLGRLQVPQRPDARFTRAVPLFDEVHRG